MGENVGVFSNQAINIGFVGRFTRDPLSERELNILNSLIDCGIAKGFSDIKF